MLEDRVARKMQRSANRLWQLLTSIMQRCPQLTSSLDDERKKELLSYSIKQFRKYAALWLKHLVHLGQKRLSRDVEEESNV